MRRKVEDAIWFLIENVPSLLTVAFTAYVLVQSQRAALQEMEVLLWLLGVVGLLATSELIERFRRLKRIEDVSLKTLDAIQSLALQVEQLFERTSLGRPVFHIDTMKQAACYLGHPEAQNVTRVLVVNRIPPVLWFMPEMVIYFLDLFRHIKDHPVEEFIRISVFDDEEEWRRAHDPLWRMLNDIDPLKAFIAINQMAGITLKGLTLGKFSEAVERFIATNEARIQAIGGTDTNKLKNFIKNAAFIMYCEDEKPIKVFCGRRYPPEQVIKFPPIDNTAEQELYYELFTKLDEVASPLPLVNLAKAPW
jgi:hypothetical protein